MSLRRSDYGWVNDTKLMCIAIAGGFYIDCAWLLHQLRKAAREIAQGCWVGGLLGGLRGLRIGVFAYNIDTVSIILRYVAWWIAGGRLLGGLGCRNQIFLSDAVQPQACCDTVSIHNRSIGDLSEA